MSTPININKINNLIAVFLVNELTGKLIDTDTINLPQSEMLIKYRNNIDLYTTGVIIMLGEKNHLYDEFYKRLMEYLIRYTENKYTENAILYSMCEVMCTTQTLLKLDLSKIKDLFRKFITGVLNMCSTYVNTKSDEYTQILSINKSINPKVINNYRTTILKQFEIIITRQRAIIYREFTMQDSTVDKNSLENIELENKMIECLKDENEKLIGEIESLKNQINILKSKLLVYEEINKKTKAKYKIDDIDDDSE